MKFHTRCVIPRSERTGPAGKRVFQMCRFAIAAMLGVAACAAQGDNYPSKPIRVVVDSAAGGVNDIWLRRVARYMTESLGQPLVIENRPGATGAIAAEAVAKSVPDGYTVLYGGMSPLITYPGSGGSVKYDPQRDFLPTAITAMGHPMLAINSALGVRTLDELQAFAKQHPEGLACGTSGQASVNHFACAMAARALGLQLRMIPYKANIFALQDAASGQIHLVTGYTSEVSPFLQSGRLVSLAVYSSSRSSALPSVPAFAEMGYANMELPSFGGFFFPANTPQEVISKINIASVQAMRRPEMEEALRSAGSVHKGYNPEQVSEYVRAEQAKWKRISNEMGIKVAQ